jgi:hypothetical protein
VSTADRDPVLNVDKNGQRHFSRMAWINKRPTTSTIWKPPSKPWMAPEIFKGERTSHIYAEATNNTMHGASRDTTSSGTRIISDLSHVDRPRYEQSQRNCARRRVHRQ